MEDSLVLTGMGVREWGDVRSVITRVLTPIIVERCGELRNRSMKVSVFFARKYKGQRYLAYFQAYSNTYAPLDVLKLRYEEALAHPMISGLVIGTRPDVVSEEVLDYLEELARRYYVCVEYGVESVNDTVLRQVNRGHDFAVAEQAIRATAGRGITIGAHLIFGLPGESRESMLEGAIRLCELPIQVLKLHQLQIVKGTRLAEQYLENPALFRLYTLDEYLDFVVEVIERIRSDVYLELFRESITSRIFNRSTMGN